MRTKDVSEVRLSIDYKPYVS
ncbi:hypothetical protein BN1200_370042 [Klebsiella variicola]|nr:hypothetical protein KV8917_280222 [Klebsiella variicola]CTQ09119.1 hypothetical protein BN1200_370042 [Klebsiella variicola]SBM97719.1 hypothetical protein KVMX100_120474 [Klebsiella variicola]